MKGNLIVIDKTFKLKSKHYDLNRDLALEYSSLAEQVKQIRNKTATYRKLKDKEMSKILINNLKRIAEIQKYFKVKAEKMIRFENCFEILSTSRIKINLDNYGFIKTNYYKLRGVKVLYSLKDIANKSTFNINDLDIDTYYEDLYSDFWDINDIEDEELQYNVEEEVNDIDYEGIIMRALRNGEGDRFGF